MRCLRVIVAASAVMVATALPAHAQRFDFSGAMSGGEVAPAPGDPDGAGTFKISIDNTKNELCYELAWQNIEQPDAAHVHAGSPGRAGQIMADLNLPANGPKACTPTDSTTVGHITGGPKSHYVDLHGPGFSEGALRGQLQR